MGILTNIVNEIMKPELGLGCWAFGDNYWSVEDSNGWRRNAIRAIQAALKAGIRHFDTAQGYGGGISEQITGQQLRKIRTTVSIASKTFNRPADTVVKGIEKSLRRLCTDYIDIFYIHWPKPGRDMRPLIEALEKTRQRGLIRAIGVSNFSAEQMEPLLSAGRIDYCQFGYSLLWRQPELNQIPFCRTHEIRIVTYSSLAQGVLAHSPEWIGALPKSDPRRKLLFLQPQVYQQVRPVLIELQRIAAELNLTAAQLALAWNLSREWNRYTLFGARTRRQVEECGRAADIRLPGETQAQMDALTAPLLQLWPATENIFGHLP